LSWIGIALIPIIPVAPVRQGKDGHRTDATICSRKDGSNMIWETTATRNRINGSIWMLAIKVKI
jgi:hypothetical protein